MEYTPTRTTLISGYVRIGHLMSIGLSEKQKVALQLREQLGDDSLVADVLNIRRESANRLINRARRNVKGLTATIIAAGGDPNRLLATSVR